MQLKTLGRISRRSRLTLLTGAVGAMAVFAMACASTASATPEPSPVGGQPTGANTSVSNSLGSGAVAPGLPVSESRGISSSSTAPSPYYDSSTGQAGIWVTGHGSKEVASDVAKVYLGVESKEETVKDARQNAAEAMTAVLDAIRDLNISDDDIVTTSFNIYPQTVWIEVSDSLGRHSEPRITGYTVSNNVEVTVRDLDVLDQVIDSAAEQGGNLIRVNSISFTVADPAAHGAETRELAAADARAKAELYARAMGVTLGPLVFLTETGSSAPLQTRAASQDGAYAEAGFAPTPIQSGEVNLSTTIQAAFAINP